MQLGVEGNNGSVQSYALFSADNFAIYNTNNGSYQLAFAAVNGQTFLRSAFIQDGTIDNGKIGNFIQSTNYNGTIGWRIDKNSGFFFGGAGGGGSTRMDDTGFAVYDAGGVERFKAGKLS